MIIIVYLSIFTEKVLIALILFFWLLNVITLTFLPICTRWMRQNKYLNFLRILLYYPTLLLPAIFLNPTSINSNHFSGVIMGIFCAVILLFANYREIKQCISNDNFLTKMPINKNDIITSIFSVTLTPISEEIFYRYVLTYYLFQMFSWSGIVIVALIFVHLHLMNRWANVNFSKRSYLIHFVSSIILSILFIYTGSILGCIIAHSIFNSSSVILIVKRIKNSKKQSKQIFNDYNFD